MDAAEIDPDMAAMMGFSGFGTQPAAKKRKYNHRADAVSSSAAATGANQVALATRAPAPAANADEIDLDDEDNGPREEGGAENNVIVAEADADQEEGGASLYTNPAIAPALAHAQELIDELATRGGVAAAAQDAPSSQANLAASSSLPRRPEASWGREMGSAPIEMPTRNEGPHSGGRGGGRHQHQQQRGGNDGKPWWEGYYDHKSNENPWEKLERAAGIESRGTWVARGAAQSV
ncbi:hypothetical protein CPLU01_06586 [Colletotrichum plurivorum]|uniref:Uncharacterized protein n=1 Tax=Colletotrichum plurivorum TaxID=2175906 RepID=A0A8H6NGM4_9PEZI|nr:hypothetical protein CPLU01_06586 [Colletotrichum plurivorum]